MKEIEKVSRRQQCIFNAVTEILEIQDYRSLTIEDIARRAGVGKSTIYRWWADKSDLVFDAFKAHTASIFEMDFSLSLAMNLEQQLLKLSHALDHALGRALLVVLAEHREAAGEFFKQYLRPRREETHKLIQVAIRRQELQENYPFELMLDTLYAPIHYQIIFFNQRPNIEYIQHLVQLVLAPAQWLQESKINE